MTEGGLKGAEAIPPPELIVDLPAANSTSGDQNVGVTVISYNTAAQTLRCIASLTQCSPPPSWILVLDNASDVSDLARLAGGMKGSAHSHIKLFGSRVNLGFAAGSNFLIDQLLNTPCCQYIGLLNNDAVAKPGWVQLLRAALFETTQSIGMSGGRMHRLHQPEEVDTLGISLYASLMPADRKETTDPYLGPTGGCCLLTRVFVQDIIATTGYFYDARFFCYCEDTDLALRANLLGYQPAYIDQVVALHEGQASSSTQADSFIAYHGMRNLIWMHCKFMPTSLLVRNALWLLLAHLLNVVKQIISGRPRVLFALYRDAFRQHRAMFEERVRLKGVVRSNPAALSRMLSKRFYRKGYSTIVMGDLTSRLRNVSQSKPKP